MRRSVNVSILNEARGRCFVSTDRVESMRAAERDGDARHVGFLGGSVEPGATLPLDTRGRTFEETDDGQDGLLAFAVSPDERGRGGLPIRLRSSKDLGFSADVGKSWTSPFVADICVVSPAPGGTSESVRVAVRDRRPNYLQARWEGDTEYQPAWFARLGAPGSAPPSSAAVADGLRRRPGITDLFVLVHGGPLTDSAIRMVDEYFLTQIVGMLADIPRDDRAVEPDDVGVAGVALPLEIPRKASWPPKARPRPADANDLGREQLAPWLASLASSAASRSPPRGSPRGGVRLHLVGLGVGSHALYGVLDAPETPRLRSALLVQCQEAATISRDRLERWTHAVDGPIVATFSKSEPASRYREIPSAIAAVGFDVKPGGRDGITFTEARVPLREAHATRLPVGQPGGPGLLNLDCTAALGDRTRYLVDDVVRAYLAAAGVLTRTAVDRAARR